MVVDSVALTIPSSRLALSFHHSNRAQQPPPSVGFPGGLRSSPGGTEVGWRSDVLAGGSRPRTGTKRPARSEEVRRRAEAFGERKAGIDRFCDGRRPSLV